MRGALFLRSPVAVVRANAQSALFVFGMFTAATSADAQPDVAATPQLPNRAKCCCLAVYGEDFVADLADLPMQPAVVPKYPEAALAGHWSAQVLLYVSIDLIGRRKSMRVERVELSGGPRSSPGMAKEEETIRRAFEAETLEAAKQWRFKDCSEYGGPIARSRTIPVDFHWSDEADRPATENKTAAKS